jgi:hypothetical protein
MNRIVWAGLAALLSAGLVGSMALADADAHKSDCLKRWGHCSFQAKPSPTTLPFEPSCQPALPYQGPEPAGRYYAPLPGDCFRGKPVDPEDNCGCKWLQKLKSCGRNDCGPCR